MRKLTWFTLGFGLSCGLRAYLLPGGGMLWLALGGALLWAAVSAADRKRRYLPITTAVLGCILGCIWCLSWQGLFLSDLTQLDDRILPATVRIRDFSFETDYGSAADVTVEVNGKSRQARAYFRDRELFSPGDTLTGDFRFRITTPEGSEPSAYHKGRGIFLLLYQKGDLTRSQDTETTWMDSVACFRKDLKGALSRYLPADTAPFGKALLLGDTTDFDYETDTAFKISGIRHVVAVSGLHVSILFGLLSVAVFKNRVMMSLLGFPLLIFFGALAGFTPSVTRACLMWSLTLAARLLDKDYDSATALSFAALTMLILNPLVISDVGFQLSVSSVAGIYLFSGKLRKWLLGLFGAKESGWKASLWRWISGSAAVSAGAIVLTTPLCALHFGTVSLVGAVTNLLVLWIISFLFYGLAAVCALAFFWPAAALVLGKCLALPIRYVLLVAKVMAANPLAAVYTRSIYIVLWLVFVYGLLFVFLIRKKPRPGVLACCMVIGLCLALLASWTEGRGDTVCFTVLDVGQGQCLLFQTGGNTIMVDCGGDSDAGAADTAAEALLSKGITKLDALILTHYDRDHAGGVAGLLSRVDTRLLVLPPDYSETSFQTEGKVVYAAQELLLTLGNANLRIFPAFYPGNSNENSLCVLFDSEKCDILVTGDRNGFGERSLLRNGEIPRVDILVAGHHGAKNAVCQELLTAVRPEIVCISAGRDNAYGHPAEETLARLKEFGCDVRRTDLDGEIVIRR